MRWIASALVAFGLVVPSFAEADVLSSKSRVSLFKSQTKVLDTRARQQYNNSVRLHLMGRSMP